MKLPWILILIVMLMGACKNKNTNTKASKNNGGTSTVVQAPPVTPGTVTTPNGNATLQDPYTYDIDLPANQSFTTPAITTDNLLEVVFIPSLDMNGNIHSYSKLSVKITVNGRSEITPALMIAQASSILNFSDRVGSGSLTITVSDPAYDFYCINYGLGCPLKGMYDPNARTDWTRVKWAGRLIIGTNKTKRIDTYNYNANFAQQCYVTYYGGYVCN